MLVFYVGLLLLALGLFALIQSAGTRLESPGAGTIATGATAAVYGASALMRLLVALVLIVLTSLAVGRIFKRVGQPHVMGEVVGGILLGPSLLGVLAPEVQAALFPASVLPHIGMHAQLGIILYMFLVGLELDLGVIRRSGHVTIAISHASIVVPFMIGALLALTLYPTLAPPQISFTVFALFLGVSLSVTAFPVLARILTDRNISRSRMGTIALACAAVDDATAWCLLAVVVSIAHARASDALITILLTIAFVTFMLLVAVPVVRRVLPSIERQALSSRTALTVALVGLLASAATTEYIGIHGLFGAFLFGAVIPGRSLLAGQVKQRLEDVVAILFLPAFFAFTGMRTEIGLVNGLSEWMLCLLIVAAACVGKFGGTFIAARFVGIPMRDATALGVLMNTRGLVELIVLNIGLDMGVLSPKLFTMLVIMALATTLMTGPLLTRLLRREPWQELSAAAGS